MSFFALFFSPIGISIINVLLTIAYSFVACMLHWFCRREEMLQETTGFKYLFRFFVSASFNRFTASLYFIPGLSFLVPIAYTISLYYAVKTGIYFYKNRYGILLAVSLRRRLIDADGVE